MLARHHHILNDRSLYGLPRKFNVAFDGAGKIAVLEDTNDIAFSAIEVKDGFGVEPGVWFRLRTRRHHRPRGFCRDPAPAASGHGSLEAPPSSFRSPWRHQLKRMQA